ncbi:DMT family transporter [Endozoicomonas lisbonensis]|uniref:Transporter family-2 protein n=1 Tax=Endozoicomonas lisbonensis TaxID=3120522 RepID=A0ABV2SEP3_9GAMM
MQWLFLPVLALIAGSLIPVQAAANAVLSKSLNGVIFSALTLFFVGFCFVGCFALFNKAPFPTLESFMKTPLFSYGGGIIVATYVLSITFLAPRMGVGNAICFIVTGQIIAAVIIDHFGLMGSIQTSINYQRTLGVAIMVVGLFLARS